MTIPEHNYTPEQVAQMEANVSACGSTDRRYKVPVILRQSYNIDYDLHGYVVVTAINKEEAFDLAIPYNDGLVSEDYYVVYDDSDKENEQDWLNSGYSIDDISTMPEWEMDYSKATDRLDLEVWDECIEEINELVCNEDGE